MLEGIRMLEGVRMFEGVRRNLDDKYNSSTDDGLCVGY